MKAFIKLLTVFTFLTSCTSNLYIEDVDENTNIPNSVNLALQDTSLTPDAIVLEVDNNEIGEVIYIVKWINSKPTIVKEISGESDEGIIIAILLTLLLGFVVGALAILLND